MMKFLRIKDPVELAVQVKSCKHGISGKLKLKMIAKETSRGIPMNRYCKL